MARNLLMVAKVLPSVDQRLDAVVGAVHSPRDLFQLVGASQSGRGLLYWASWYDGWLMADDLDPGDWRWSIPTTQVCRDVWTLSLQRGNWAGVMAASSPGGEYPNRQQFAWHLWQAHVQFQSWNHSARLIYAREMLGPSLDDAEVTQRHGN